MNTLIHLIALVLTVYSPAPHEQEGKRADESTAQCRTIIYDGFETSSMGQHWNGRKLLPGALQIQSSVVRDGKWAASITLRQGDQLVQEIGSELERAELEESRALWSVEGASYSYSFSIFVPQDFPIALTRLVIAQWKQLCPAQSCTPDNPIIAIRYDRRELFITHQVSQQKQILYRTREDIRNRWLDFRFQVRFSRSPYGHVRAWLGNNLIINYRGINANPTSGGYEDQSRFYFKMGLYRDRMPEPMTIYLDEYRKEEFPTVRPGRKTGTHVVGHALALDHDANGSHPARSQQEPEGKTHERKLL
jgi:hypothetical protein